MASSAVDPLASAKPVEADPLADAKPSVFDPKPSLGQKFKQIGKAIAAPAAGAGTAIEGAEIGGALGGPPGAIAGAAIGGLAAPVVEHATQSAVTGQPYQPVSRNEVIKSAVTNAAFTGVGEVGGALTRRAQVGDAVREELQKLPQAQRTTGKIKQIREAIQKRFETAAGETAKVSEQDLRNRAFWKAHGLNDEQIDSVIKSPDLQAQLAQSIKAGGEYKNAFQAVLDNQRTDFAKRFDTAYGGLENAPMPMSPVGNAIQRVYDSLGTERQLSPGLKKYLDSKLAEFGSSEEVAPEVSSSKTSAATNEQIQKLNQRLKAERKGEVAAPKATLTAHELRDFVTELNEHLPRGASQIDKMAVQQVEGVAEQLFDRGLKEAGAKPEQLAAFDAVRSDYRRFMNTVRELDPRSADYGKQVGDLLFDPMAKESEVALNFMNMAKAAEAARPGQVMPQLREAFLQKALAESRVGGQPMDELKMLQKLQKTWGTDKNTRAVMGEMFGKDSPLADPATFTKVVDASNHPENLKLAAAQPGFTRSVLSSKYFQAMISAALAETMMGLKPTSFFQGLTGQKGPEVQTIAILSALAGPKVIDFMVKSGNSPLQRAAVAFLTNPNADSAAKWAGMLAGGVGTAMNGLPTPEETAGAGTNP